MFSKGGVIRMHERIKEIRKALNLTQDEFAEKIGLARNSIANYEGGRRNPNDAVIKLICREFNVDYFWLTEGIGEMFTEIPETLIDNIALEYNLSDSYKAILQAFLEVPDEQKEVISDFFLSIAKNVQKKGEE